MSLALTSNEELNAHLYAAIRLIFVSHRDHHYGNLRYCAKPLKSLLDEPEAKSVIALKLGKTVVNAVEDLLVFHNKVLKELDHYMASFSNRQDAPDFKPTHFDIAAALPAIDTFLKQDIDLLEISQITLRLNQQFAMAGMLHSKPQF